jgi:hypothetical protein
VQEVLNRKSFDEQLIRKIIMSAMRGGRVCININGIMDHILKLI